MRMGPVISYSALAMLALNGAPPLIPEDYGAWQQMVHTGLEQKDNFPRFCIQNNMVVHKYTHRYPIKNWMYAGFFASFLIPTIFMGVAIAVFLIGSPRYIKVPAEVVFILCLSSWLYFVVME